MNNSTLFGNIYFKKNQNKIKVVLIFLSIHFLSQNIFAQESKWKWKFSGNMGLYGDFYSMISDTPGAVAARRPGSSGRFMVNTSLSFGDFSLPMSMMLSPGQSSVVYPNLPPGNLIDYVRNPNNRIGIAPKYKWAQLMLGTQVPMYSELSVGDLPVFGAGLNLSPGKFRFAVFAGTSQLAINEDTAKNIQGIYARNIYSAKIGYGKEDLSHLYLIASMMEDDTSSLRKKPV
ncbi:MAG: hypothetical protein NTU43_02605, partial [Bacteroidetes bacterium]|nr:hypothetical protein [Bacteroidota bacterium]